MRSDSELRAIRDSVAKIGRLSDGLVRVGPFRLGIDGVLAWIPGVGEVYSAGAAVFILTQGARAGVPAGVLAVAGGLMASRTVITAVPIAGAVAADLLTTHRWAAKLVVAAIDKKLCGPTQARNVTPGAALALS